MKNLLKIMLNGAFDNFKRIFFASDRVTDMELRNAILTGTVEPEPKVDDNSCIGCAGCANVCPTGAITMSSLLHPVKITENWTKTQSPELDPQKCVVCYWCHDFCPIYSLYGEAGAIHPNNVGDIPVNSKELMSEPFKISEDKLALLSQYLEDTSVFNQNKIKQTANESATSNPSPDADGENIESEKPSDSENEGGIL